MKTQAEWNKNVYKKLCAMLDIVKSKTYNMCVGNVSGNVFL